MRKFDDRLILEFSNTKVPGKSIEIEYRESMRGLRLGEYKPNRCKVIHVGKDFKIETVQDKEVMADVIHSVLNAKESRVSNEEYLGDLEDVVQRIIFINKIGESK